MKKIVIFFIALCMLQTIWAQNISQTIKGRIFDVESQSPIPLAAVVILNTNPQLGVVTDLSGNFMIERVPIGRYKIQISFVGYNTTTVPEVLVSSGKETVLEIGMKQSINQLNEAVVHADSKKELPLNSMAIISARSFTVEETRRYAGGMDDPARMASAFAGITVGNMQDNAIVIRGNSPKGVSWRLEGVEIPNPNHFAGGNVAGGGFVTIFSSQLLANSDFFTGAFPAEYGNALAGVFDMKLRNGNSDKREHTVQVGMLGIDISSEGPFVKGKKASYLFNYRYSTTGLVSSLGLIPSQQIPKYQDLSFKLNFPTQKFGTFSVWGIGGLDQNTEPEEKDTTKWESDWDRIKYRWTLNMGALGLTHKKILGNQTYISSTLVATGTQNTFDEYKLNNDLILMPNTFLQDKSGKVGLNTFINHKFNARHTLRFGINQSQLFYNLDLNGTTDANPETFQNFVKENGKSSFTEMYIQSKYDITENLTLNAGINANYFNLNRKYSIDPRAGIKWLFAPNQSLSFGYGKHSQLEELKIYMIRSTIGNQTKYPNKNLGFSQAQHFVLGYELMINENYRLKLEPYLQYLYNMPGIEDSSYSMINFQQDWTFHNELKNNSIGVNKGIDLTIERFLSNNYYFLVTASVFKSTYKADDNVWRNTRFNKGFVLNLLYGREIFLSKNRILGVNGRLNVMGGERYNPILMEESIREKKPISDDNKAFEKQYPATSYLDLTISYRINKAKRSSVIALQVKNLLGSPMHEGYFYNFKSNAIESSETVVVLPVISYKIEF